MQRNVLVLYKQLLVAAKSSFPGFPKGREYALATVRGEFKKNRDIQSPEQLAQVIKSADERLRLLRQSAGSGVAGTRNLANNTSNFSQPQLRNVNNSPPLPPLPPQKPILSNSQNPIFTNPQNPIYPNSQNPVHTSPSHMHASDTLHRNNNLSAADHYKQLDEQFKSNYVSPVQKNVNQTGSTSSSPNTNKLSQICKQQIEGIEYISTVNRGAQDVPNAPDQWPRSFLQNITK